ncbi:DNA/RNA non-specific endonuclease [Rhodoplanes sp. TEM]|uniref:Serine protease n=1 Tax=Rhodoplanes tepidamans TaxID=200616 RepID=A0ABT5JJ61_RHOTP|nr:MULTISPECIES: DNA/RNA non-specific endonuclease [Rhodoplanes]MDC7789408.1 DNA/RNA non-specific endonuclease [Rhodoplanes tepidamans]MDC7986464.1 DNA/RNA non-specific endonuclease [Rhodoplanes sp. TEM]MDQ0358956.1 endonuclease G [Rhodoplanes tepidamans]
MNAEQLRRGVARILSRRPDIAARLAQVGVDAPAIARAAAPSDRGRLEFAGPAIAAATGAASPVGLPRSVSAEIESIIEMVGRPTLFVSGDDFDLPAEEELALRLRAARAAVAPRLRSVGRVEVFDGMVKWPIGTAWMVAEGIAVTNRHVAERFATTDANGRPVLLTDLRGRPYRVVVDFREEHGTIEESEIAVEAVVYLPHRSSAVADVALLRLAGPGRLPPPIPLATGTAAPDRWIAVVGYPQPDERIPPEARAVEETYFSGVYGVKRLSPGQIDRLDLPAAPAWLLAHDATTLGGNSGSVLLDLSTGAAVGLHFMGEYRRANYAVAADEIARILGDLGLAPTRVPAAPSPVPAEDVLPAGAVEAAEDLSGFAGYAADFILPRGDASFEIPLPEVTGQAPGEVATLTDGSGSVLHYRNFSVVMNAARRLCYFSAVNIDGSKTFSINGQRPRWRTDRRLDEALQIIGECYGPEDQGKFSRGHMTRREDPNWGDRREDAVTSNRHTFFVTNACPQVQPFNAGLWLSLENYALENCDQDDMRISVFTGPIFRDDDPEFFGVPVPTAFFKILAFRHDSTKALSATGYVMSQRDVLPSREEFVFGQFRSSQVTIRHIERETGLSFHHLRDHDPFDDGTEAVAVRWLRRPTDIRFA